MARTFRMLIGGQLVPGTGTFPVINPSTGKPFAEAPACSKNQLDEAVRAARQALPSWMSLSPANRRDMMLSGTQKLKQELTSLSEVLVKEQGKPLASARGEIMGVISFMTHFAKLEFESVKVLAENSKERIVQRRTPVGVVAGITPWNYPPLMAAWKMAEALMTGNAIVLKPSPYTPLSTLLIGEILADTFPAGVLNVVSGGDEVGQWLSEHEGIAKVSFTGSTRTGKHIYAASSSSLKHLTLELGGNDAAIVLQGADVKSAAAGIFNQAMGNSGQVCIAVKRLYVHESQMEAMVEELATLARQAKVGDGFEKDVKYGPINNKMQFDRVKELVEDAKARGAKVHAGGAPLDRDGYFYPPTILSAVQEGMRIVDEEQFGPVLPVMPYNTIDEAVSRANSTSFGLGGSVWGDAEQAEHVASMMVAGNVWVNSHGTLSPDIPFGGLKESGIGRQFGEGTIEGYTETKVIRVPKTDAKL
eukprot:TRINITY_DN51941_c0_g1_i1.p1 TRINITY_DN51941_c0_g1~~TRINITY_DN51941_c0_g1_i1.p1  ORF type:complete len:484 (-),score=109.93 TRINITY_DN51941_c0_g1_i1:47-1471(-)